MAAALHDHGHAESRPQRDERPRIYRVSRQQVKTVLLHERRKRQLRFHQREVIADALPRTGAEGYVRKLVALGDALREKAFGHECVRLVPQCWVSVERVWDDEREPSAR